MKSIRLSHSSKNAVKDFSDSNLNNNISQLIDFVADYMPLVDLSDESSTVVTLDDDIVDKINSFKLTNGESVDNVIVRMLVMAQGLNSIDDK